VISGDLVNTLYFTTQADAVIDPQVDESPGTEEVSAVEGRYVTIVSDNANTYGELIGTSTGLPNMSFELGEVPSVDGTTELYVQDGDIYSKWTQVQHLLDSGPTDLVYQVNTDANNNVFIAFGDGVSGVIPTIHSEIRVNYMVGGGLIGNVPSNTLVDIVYVPGLSTNQTTALQAIVLVTNADPAIGGSDPETTNQIRVSAPAALRAANRAVTLQDYADLSIAVSGVGKANAFAEIWTSVTVYIAPSRSAIDSDLAPGLDDLGAPTLEYDRLKADVETYLSDKVLLGTTVTIQPPTYVDLIITLQYAKQDQYTTAEIELALKQALLSSFGYNGMNFQDTIYPQDIEFSLNQVPGVKTVKVTNLHIEGGSGLGTVVGAADEIFRFQEDNISIGTI
jgi:predicted phage baseplate assembly protein